MHEQGSVHILSWPWAGAVTIHDAAFLILHWKQSVVMWSTEECLGIFKELTAKSNFAFLQCCQRIYAAFGLYNITFLPNDKKLLGMNSKTNV